MSTTISSVLATIWKWVKVLDALGMIRVMPFEGTTVIFFRGTVVSNGLLTVYKGEK